MKIGLVAYAGSVKTSVFNTMTGMDVPVGFVQVNCDWASYEFRTIASMSYPPFFPRRRRHHAQMVFCDVPGKHGAEKRGLSPRGLQQIRDQKALCQVLRDFVNPA